MKCVNNCGECPYAKRCKPNSVRIITLYKRMCNEYYEENSSGWCCFKYNPILVHCRDLALSTFKNRHNMTCNDSDALQSKEDAKEALEIFKQIFNYIVSLEE